MKNIIIMFIAILCLASDCKKEEKPIYYMTQEFKDYAVFPQGSYWVYKDSISGINDSINLQNQTIEIIEPKNLDYKNEFLQELLFSSYLNKTIAKIGNYNNIGNNSYSYSDGQMAFFISNISIGTSDSYMKYISNYDSLLINNVWYKDVKVFSYNAQPAYNIYTRISYFSRFIGMIKFTIMTYDSSENKIRELKNYKINQ